MNDYTFSDDSKKWFRIFDGLIVNNEDMFFNALYMAITHHPTYVIASDLEDERKITILGAMLIIAIIFTNYIYSKSQK